MFIHDPDAQICFWKIKILNLLFYCAYQALRTHKVRNSELFTNDSLQSFFQSCKNRIGKTLRRVDGCRYVAKMQPQKLHWKTANNCECDAQKRIILLSSYLTNSDQGVLTSLRKNYIAFLSIHSLDRIKGNLYKASKIKRYTKLISSVPPKIL